MLQQTQTDRVLKKYGLFLRMFPDWRALAAASLRKILFAWQGLGYNRRALALKRAAEKVIKEWNGDLPSSIETLGTLPGIGPATASAVAAFAFNAPAVFIETNIRAVFIRFFFKRKKHVRDDEILPFIAQTLDRYNPRRWYWALMDYGAMLKKKYPNLSHRSAGYRTQSRFRGSRR